MYRMISKFERADVHKSRLLRRAIDTRYMILAMRRVRLGKMSGLTVGVYVEYVVASIWLDSESASGQVVPMPLMTGWSEVQAYLVSICESILKTKIVAIRSLLSAFQSLKHLVRGAIPLHVIFNNHMLST